ncbi:MAG: MBL fold metallo-hydrolase [Anaerolineae bacterium]|nr:MBL fold metallo-hydrolase [Anaerolineae bacterium]
MLLRYFFDPKLAHASYMVGCQETGQAIVIDPGRNIEPYLEAARAESVYIVAAAETHIHADFVSGCRVLADKVGAMLYLSGEGGPDWQYQYLADYPHRLLKDGDSWQIGRIKFDVMHTPGHTPEHVSFVVRDGTLFGLPMGVFSGDFVFVGDVGRPDLLETAAGIKGTKEQGARMLFSSLQRFKKMPDYLQIWPAHGAGSACGKALGAVPSTTLGYERLTNWAFQIEDEAKFVTTVLTGQPEPPRYFATMKRVNKEGPALINDGVLPPRLSIETLETLRQSDAPIMDARSISDFAWGHIPGTFNNPFSARTFMTYAGSFLNEETPFYLIIEETELQEAVTDLRRIGLDKIAGFFTPQTVSKWSQETGNQLNTIPQTTIEEVAHDIKAGQVAVIDVRGAVEFAAGHLPTARNIVLGNILNYLAEIPDDQPVVLHCLSGFRSNIAAGLLSSRGRNNIKNLEGDYQAWYQARQPVLRS